MQTIAEALEKKRNNFDILRLVAALLVLFSHSYPLAGENFEPIYHFLGGYDTGGGWAVSIFFVISGFLVAQSVMTRSTSVYFASRILRIFPALIVVVLLQVFVFGTLFTSLSLEGYLSSSKTYAYLQKAFIFFGPGTLPGVFADNPLKSVNGSLWTLNIEVFFYCVLPIIALLGLLGRPSLLIYATLFIVYAISVEGYGLNWANQGGRLAPGVPLFSALKQGLFFLSGTVLWVYRSKIRLSSIFAAMCLVFLALMANKDYRQYVLIAVLPYLTIYCALMKPIRVQFYDKIGDLSYGAYIYAFPVQQMVVAALGREIGPIALTAIATPITLFLAFLSWTYIEKPALSLRQTIQGRGPVAPTDQKVAARV